MTHSVAFLLMSSSLSRRCVCVVGHRLEILPFHLPHHHGQEEEDGQTGEKVHSKQIFGFWTHYHLLTHTFQIGFWLNFTSCNRRLIENILFMDVSIAKWQGSKLQWFIWTSLRCFVAWTIRNQNAMNRSKVRALRLKIKSFRHGRQLNVLLVS